MERPHPDYDTMCEALGEHSEAQTWLEELRCEMDAEQPDPEAIHGHVHKLRGVAALEAPILTWWESPPVQHWVKGLTDAGL